MFAHIGVIAKDFNPFATLSWIDQGYGITEHRLRLAEKLFGKRIEEINRMKANEGNYPAFVAIRWGIAAISGGKLVPIDAAYRRCINHLKKSSKGYRGH